MIALLIGLAAAQGYIGDTTAIRLSQRQINLIAAQCHVPRSWIRLRRDGTVRFRFPTSARYRDVDCVLIRATPLVRL
jgi:hypothetical protein